MKLILSHLEEQMKAGKKIPSTVEVIQPYGQKPYRKGKGVITAVIETLIGKAGQNLDQEQFRNGKTFLILNLSLIHLDLLPFVVTFSPKTGPARS